uniref:Uncharacterized protein n=1 Tax=Anguilla anguilla TaxID=7936 RepID=A0A0E9RIN2_ANGAN
MRSRQPLLFT